MCVYHDLEPDDDDAVQPEPEPEPVNLDIGETELLNPDLGRAKINARPRNKRAPTPAHHRQDQLGEQNSDTGNNTVGGSTCQPGAQFTKKILGKFLNLA